MALFDQLFAPLSYDQFRSAYFNKRPLFLGGDASRTDGLLSIHEFFDCLGDCEDVRAVFPELRQARIAPKDAWQMFEAGATICATGLELGNQSLSEILGNLKSQIQYTGHLSFRGYYSPPHAGFAPHFDTRIVTTLQIEGSKTWSFGKHPIELFPMKNSPIPLNMDFKDHIRRGEICTQTLVPGDLLCLPAGTIHWAEAHEKPSFALNLAFDYINDSIADHIADNIRKILLTDHRLRSAAFLPLDDTTKNSIRLGVERAKGILDDLRESPEFIYD